MALCRLVSFYTHRDREIERARKRELIYPIQTDLRDLESKMENVDEAAEWSAYLQVTFPTLIVL